MAAETQDKPQAALAYIWGLFNTYDITSVKRKTYILRWRKGVFALTIAGALFGVGSQYVASLDNAAVARVLGGLAGLSAALAAFVGKEALTTDDKHEWVRTRSMAEGLKSLAYLVAMSVPPYQGAQGIQRAMDRVKELLDRNSDLPVETLEETAKQKGMPVYGMPIEDYIEQRIKNQALGYYPNKIDENCVALRRGKIARSILGIAAIVLGTTGAMGWSFQTAPLVAVATTISATVAGYLFAGRYSYLQLSYQSTTQHLAWLLTSWGSSEQTEQNRLTLISECEDTISKENKTWLAEWGKKDEPEKRNQGQPT